MMKQNRHLLTEFRRHLFPSRRLSLLAALMLCFFIGYNISLALYNSSLAGGGGQGHLSDSTSDSSYHVNQSDFYHLCAPGTTYPSNYVFCDIVGSATLSTDEIIYPSFFSKIKKVSKKFEEFLWSSIDTIVYSALQRLQDTELNMVMWWKTMFTYNLRPSMQAQTEQIGAAMGEQAKDLAAASDANAMSETITESKMIEANTKKSLEADENGCPAATLSGGMGRATSLGTALAVALESEALDAGNNTKGSPGADGTAGYLHHTEAVYDNILCDPDSNGGQNNCPATIPSGQPFANADTRVTENILNRSTIPLDSQTPVAGLSVTESDAYKAVVTQGIENLVGSAVAEPLPAEVAKKVAGHAMLMERRKFLARLAAARSVPNWSVIMRTPGSKMKTWVEEIQKEAGVDTADMSQNPSYREIIKALTIDRFNSGKYAFNGINDQTKVEMEKLRLDTFYLMMLRDYFELLERQSLTLAVQVAIMADQIPLPDLAATAPIRKP